MASGAWGGKCEPILTSLINLLACVWLLTLRSATLDLAYTAMGSFDIWWEGGCWEWDVAAGVCILLEAGGLVTTANPPADSATAPIEEVRLGSRLYLAVR